MDVKYIMPEDVALAELAELLEFHLDEQLTWDEIQNDYPQVIKAMREGLLVIDEDKVPIYTLKKPIMSHDGSSIQLEVVKFRTRITLQEKRDLEKGVDIAKEKIKYQHKGMAWLIGQPLAMLDKIQANSRYDTKVIEQLGSAFFN